MTFVNQYVVIKYLGKGANGRVFLCLDMCDTRLYAVKARPTPHLGYQDLALFPSELSDRRVWHERGLTLHG